MLSMQTSRLAAGTARAAKPASGVAPAAGAAPRAARVVARAEKQNLWYPGTWRKLLHCLGRAGAEQMRFKIVRGEGESDAKNESKLFDRSLASLDPRKKEKPSNCFVGEMGAPLPSNLLNTRCPPPFISTSSTQLRSRTEALFP